jgi:hypothetical protein
MPSLFVLATLALAQDRGAITGTVTDNSGASVPNTKITLSNPATGFTQSVMTGNDGNYSFLYLAAGKYEISTEKEGFRKAGVNDVAVQVSTTTRVDIRLVVGSVTETVEVQGGAPLLQTDRSDLGKVVDNRAIQQLPLFINGGLRSNLAFVLLTPGANMSITSDPDTAGSIRIAGGQANGASLRLDGGESMSERRNDPQMRVVSAEGVEEFKVQTGAYSAEYGRSSNGILNYTTKSGTNAYHGSALLNIRNEHLNAEGFFWGARTKTLRRQNLQSVGIGGPVRIPKLYDGRNKAFFYFAGERSRAKDVASSSLITLPIQDFRNGDFRRYTQVVNGVTQMKPLYDPFDAAGNIIADANQRPLMQCNGVINVICPNRIDPVAQAILKHLPLPDNPDVVFQNTVSRINGTRTPGENQGVYSIKGDYIFNDKFRVNGLFSRQYFNSYTLTGPIPGPLAEAFQEFGDSKYIRLNADYVIKPNVLNHFTFGHNRRNLGEGPNLLVDDPNYRQATLIPGVSADKAPNYSKYNTEFGNYGGHVNTISPGRTTNFSDQVAWLKGRHTMKIGFEMMQINYRRIDCNNCVGVVTTGAGSTARPNQANSGIDYAGFLLGLASSANFSFGADIDFGFKYYAWYFQDDIKLTKKLTLNAGLRYDLPFPRLEKDRQNSNFNPSIPNPGAGGLLGALEFAGDGPGRSGRDRLQFVRKNGFGPRLGLAYQITPKTVIRAGGSITYDSIREDNNADTGITGFGGGFSAVTNYLSSGIAFRFNQGFNVTPDLVNAARPVRIDPTIGLNGSPSYKAGESGMPGYYIDYNFTIEHSITPNTLVRGSFHANNGVKLRMGQNFNQLHPMYLALYGDLLSSPLSTAMNNPIVINSGFRLPYPGYPTNLQLTNALRPFPQYSGVSGDTLSGHSTYNALETSLEHRFSKGLYASASYTFSKWLNAVAGADVYEKQTDKVIAGTDRPHILAFSYIYELPVGKGKRFLSNAHPVVNGIIGNWTISGVQRYQSGNPIGIGCGQNLFGAGSARCSLVPGQPLKNPNWDPKSQTSPYLNRAAFEQPPNRVYGNMASSIAQLRQPVQMNEDLAVSKFWGLGKEGRTLEFRASAFNVANRHLLGGLSTGLTGATFGQFSTPQSNQARNLQFGLRVSF